MIILPSSLSISFMINNCWLNNGNTCPPALCAGKAPDEKLKINELGPKDSHVIVVTKYLAHITKTVTLFCSVHNS